MLFEEQLARLLIQKKKTLALAESCTGGLLAARLTDIPGSSVFLKAALVTYSNTTKTKLLKVPATLIKRHGAVSTAVAEKMAQNVRKLLKTDFGVAITGIAGPTGGSRAKPVGLTYIAVATHNELLSVKCIFKGSRKKIRGQAADTAMYLLLEFLA